MEIIFKKLSKTLKWQFIIIIRYGFFIQDVWNINLSLESILLD